MWQIPLQMKDSAAFSSLDEHPDNIIKHITEIQVILNISIGLKSGMMDTVLERQRFTARGMCCVI